MYVGLMIPTFGGNPITTEAVMMPMITAAQTFYLQFCSIEVVYTGACVATPGAPESALTFPCNEKGFAESAFEGRVHANLSPRQRQRSACNIRRRADLSCQRRKVGPPQRGNGGSRRGARVVVLEPVPVGQLRRRDSWCSARRDAVPSAQLGEA
jgi:hypothetical protein